MCFFSSPKVPDAPPPPPAPAAIAPPPSPMSSNPTNVAAQAQADRQRKVQQTRYGLASTVKTGPKGIVGAGPELQPTNASGKTTLG